MSWLKRFGAVLLLLSFGLYAGCNAPQRGMGTQKPRVAVIVKSTGSSFWRSVKAGANAAASEYNLDFTFDGPLSEEDCAGQNRMIEEAVADGADAIVLSAIDFSGSAEAVDRAAEMGVKIVVIDSDVDSDRVAVRIGTDNYAAGREAGLAVLGGDEKTLRIGVIGFDVHTKNGQEREQGFADAVAEDSRAEIVETVNTSSDSEAALKATRDLLTRHPEINAVVTFNELTTLGVGHAIGELGLGSDVRAVGFDNNVVSVGMLETGEIDVLIVQNPFAIGYLGVENAGLLAAGKVPPSDRIDTEVRAIDREGMYSDENQKFLFSFTENQ